MSDTLGLILEMLTWVGLVPGLLLLLAAAIIRGLQGRWNRADAVTFAAGTGVGYRWYDHDYEVREALAPAGQLPAPGPGSDVVVYYNVRRPNRWRLAAPVDAARLPRLLGWIFTGVGAAAAVAGFLTMLF